MERDHIAPPNCTDYHRGATDLRYFGRCYLPHHYFIRTSPPFHQRLDASWKRWNMKGMDPMTDAVCKA